MLSEVVTCSCVLNPGGHAESNPRPSEEGVSFFGVWVRVVLACFFSGCLCACVCVCMCCEVLQIVHLATFEITNSNN